MPTHVRQLGPCHPTSPDEPDLCGTASNWRVSGYHPDHRSWPLVPRPDSEGTSKDKDSRPDRQGAGGSRPEARHESRHRRLGHRAADERAPRLHRASSSRPAECSCCRLVSLLGRTSRGKCSGGRLVGVIPDRPRRREASPVPICRVGSATLLFLQFPQAPYPARDTFGSGI
jgi:hypothetical protein